MPSQSTSFGVTPISKATPAGKFFWIPGTDAVNVGATNMTEILEKGSQFGGVDKSPIQLQGTTVATLWSAAKDAPTFDGTSANQYFRAATDLDAAVFAEYADVVDADATAQFLFFCRIKTPAAPASSDTIFTCGAKNGSNNDGWGLQVDYINSTLKLLRGDNGVTDQSPFSSINPTTANTYYNLQLLFDMPAGTVTGQLGLSDAQSILFSPITTLRANFNPIAIGAIQGFNNPFVGKIHRIGAVRFNSGIPSNIGAIMDDIARRDCLWSPLLAGV